MAEDHKINPATGDLDKIGQTASDIISNDGRYLKLDQSTPQTVINGAPVFARGLILVSGQRLVFDG